MLAQEQTALTNSVNGFSLIQLFTAVQLGYMLPLPLLYTARSDLKTSRVRLGDIPFTSVWELPDLRTVWES